MIRVIYVDDEEYLLEIGKIFLERNGDLNVDMATSVKEATEAMARSHYDALISDYQMPGEDGLQYLKKVRERDKDIPFILFTGRGREEVVIEACNSGVSFYVQKGGDPNAQFFELEHKIKQAVSKRSAEDSLVVKKYQAAMAMDLARVATFEFDVRADQFRFDDLFYHLYKTDAFKEGGYVMGLDKYFREFIHPEDLGRVLEFMRGGCEHLSPGGYAEIEHRIIRRDGEVRYIIVRVGKIDDPNGKPLTVYGISYDITDLKRAKAAILKPKADSGTHRMESVTVNG
jgi:DNA-binding response OmpR family regulator